MAHREDFENARADGHPRAVREETTAEKYDRNWNEILQELRVMQTGTQIVTAFLIVLPFQARFSELLSGLEGWYIALLVAAVLLAVIMFTPVVVHRRFFAQGIKGKTVAWGDLIVKISYVGLAILLTGCVGLVSNVTIPGSVAWIVTSGTALAITAIMLTPRRRLTPEHPRKDI